MRIHPIQCRWIVVALLGFWALGAAVSARATELSAESLIPMVTAHVREKMQARRSTEAPAASDETIAIDVLQVPGAPFRFAGDERVKVTLNSSAWDNTWSDRGIVRVRLEGAAGHSRELGVPVVVRIQKTVWLVRHPVNANAPLRLSDFSPAVRDVSRNYNYVVGAEQSVTPYVARVNLLPGELLDIRKIAIPPDIRYNDEVRILVTNENGMTLSLPGVALAEGRIGQTIRVRQSLYRRQYYNARVIDRHQVLVEM